MVDDASDPEPPARPRCALTAVNGPLALHVVLAALGLSACTGEVMVPGGGAAGIPGSDPARPGPGPGRPTPGTPPPSGPSQPDPECASEDPLALESGAKRMTAAQFEHAVRDLFGGRVDVPSTFPESRTGIGATGYSNEPSVNLTSDADAAAMVETTEAIALSLSTPQVLEAVLPCAASAPGRDCALDFVDRYGARAFRRPLTQDERGALIGAFDRTAGDGGSFGDGVAVLAQALLLSPQFLHFVDEGQATGDAVALDGYSQIGRAHV